MIGRDALPPETQRSSCSEPQRACRSLCVLPDFPQSRHHSIRILHRGSRLDIEPGHFVIDPRTNARQPGSGRVDAGNDFSEYTRTFSGPELPATAAHLIRHFLHPANLQGEVIADAIQRNRSNHPVIH